MTIKHIFTDLDGTLLDVRGNLSETNKWAIYYSELPVTLVSARSPLEMTDLIDQLDLDSPQIAFNGNLIFKKNDFGLEILEKNVIKSDQIEQILQVVTTEFSRVSLSWYSLSHWYIAKQDKGVFLQKALTNMEPRIKPFNGQSEIYKIMMMAFDESEMQLLIKRLENLNFSGLSIRRSGQWYLEITSNHSSKFEAINWILEEEGIERQEIAAIGDGENDIPMLEQAGLPIVVKNAPANVQKYAKMVVATSSDHGVAQAISAIHDINAQEVL
ncbi:HAD family hydrolase [Lactococcus fujiensis]|uniref:HAD superfamily hydrolase n=1 Tax=Lactococcus fujiensis JCM 16395 TaxID=1291764 RepID=A0A2A5RIX6_9LACT|nr:HAD family hydrolase [Lactococcus fujiensis]PCR99115.1 HAD superfamily hydrolase [Lactococcus fujiensis JCM 16395]